MAQDGGPALLSATDERCFIQLLYARGAKLPTSDVGVTWTCQRTGSCNLTTSCSPPPPLSTTCQAGYTAVVRAALGISLTCAIEVYAKPGRQHDTSIRGKVAALPNCTPSPVAWLQLRWWPQRLLWCLAQ